MHFASMSLGIFDFLLEWIASFVGTVLGWVFDIIMQIVGRLLYNIVKQILFLVDWTQTLFRKLAGLDIYWYAQNGTDVKKEGDMLLDLFTDQTVLQVFLALSLVAVAMVIIAAIIQVVRVEFTTEGSKNSKAGVLGQALKSVVMFFLVPILCVGGVMVSNALLKAVDAATSLGGNESMASQIFVSATSSANYYRINPDIVTPDQEKWLRDNGMFVDGNAEKTAVNIDNAFRTNRKFDKMPPAGVMNIVDTIINTIFNSSGGIVTGGFDSKSATYNNIYLVSTFYNIGNMNFIILIGGSLVACYIMLMTAFGLVMRLFKATVLFMISPPFIALTPIDGGNAFKGWRQSFIGQVLAGYGAIVGLNLLFIVLPIVNNINLFGGLEGSTNPGASSGTGGVSTTVGGMGGSIYNDLVHLLFTLVALYMVKDLISTIAKFINAEDATKSGADMTKKAVGTAVQLGMAAASGGASLALSAASLFSGSSANKFDGMAGKLEKSSESKSKEATDLRNRAESASAGGRDALANKLWADSDVAQKAADEDSKKAKGLREKEAEAKSKQESRSASAKGMAKSIGAQFAGSAGKFMNSTFNTKWDDKTTVAEREKFVEDARLNAEKEFDKGGGTLKDHVVSKFGRSKEGMAYAAGSDEAAKSSASGTSKAERFVNQLQTIINGATRDGAGAVTAIDKNSIAELGEEIAAAMANGSESEQNQALFREISANIKTISSAKGDELNAAVKGADGLQRSMTGKFAVANEYTTTLQLIASEVKGSDSMTDQKLKGLIKSALEDANNNKPADQRKTDGEIIKDVQAMLKDVKKYVDANKPS